MGLLTHAECKELPVALTEHYIVKDRNHCFRCQKCGRVGEVAKIKEIDCAVNFMLDAVTDESSQPPPAEICQALVEEDSLARGLQDEELAIQLLQEEMNMLEAADMLAQMEQQSIEEALAESLALISKAEQDEQPPCEVRRPTDASSLADMETLIAMGFTKEIAIWAVKVSVDLKEAEMRATTRVNSEAAFAKRKAKEDASMPPPAKPCPKAKKAAAKKEVNPFDLPPDPDQKRLFELPGVKRRVPTPVTSTLIGIEHFLDVFFKF